MNVKAIDSINMSKRDYNSLEITTLLGCPVNCLYCPQSTLISQANNISPKILTFPNLCDYLSNVPSHVRIHWTGYSEPCLTPELGKMIEFVNKKGHRQLISTTLVGEKSSALSVANTTYFDSFTLHLPDNNGLMRGIKNIESYIKNLKFLLPKIIKNNVNLTLLTFGEMFHPDIEDIIKDYQGRDIELCCDRRQHLHSRSGAVEADKITNQTNFSNPLRFYSGESSAQDNKNNGKSWYCSYKRLSQPVLLPDGRTNICCQDYSLSCITGSLLNGTYDDIMRYEGISEDFTNGNLLPCQTCEYYKPIKSSED